MNLPISAINSIRFCFIYFEATLLGSYTFRTYNLPGRSTLSSFFNILLFISRNVLYLRTTVPKLCTEVLGGTANLQGTL